MKDVQNQQDNRGVDIQKVGIKHFEMPLVVQRKDDENLFVSASVRANVSLPREYKGTHMSRFVEVLSDWNWQSKDMPGADIKKCVLAMVEKLNAKSGDLEFNFKYFIEKKSPVTGLSSQMGYNCSFEGSLENYGEEDESYIFLLGVDVPVTTLCPCSKEISDNGAHNQRAIVSVKVSYDEDEHIWIEDIIEMVEKCSSCGVYPLLKREDEKFVTEKAYNNPKFVEDVLRDVVLNLREDDRVNYFEVECESIESIHNHSAWAYQQEYK